MDSYEYYLLYHENRNEFITILSQNHENLKTLDILIKNQKLIKDQYYEKIFQKVLELIENDTTGNLVLDDILENLLTPEYFHKYKVYFDRKEPKFSDLRIANVLLNFSLKHSLVHDDLQQFWITTIENALKDSAIRLYCVEILFKALNIENFKNFILTKIVEISFQLNDSICMESLCFFFKDLCRNNNFGQRDELLKRYFQNESLKMIQQGNFLVKCLIESNLMNVDLEENWKKFITIFEALEENQSHLILPSLDLLHTMKVGKEFENFWFLLCSLIINHENNLVRDYGLDYLLGIEKRRFDKQQILKILKALNATHLYNEKKTKFIVRIKSFVEYNFENVFQVLHEVNWFPLPFYYILKHFVEIAETLNSNSNFFKHFLVFLELQTDMIPKRIRNLKIRYIIKLVYCEIVVKLMSKVNLEHVLPTIQNIFKIGGSNCCIDKCLKLIKKDDYKLALCNKYDYNFLKYVLFRTHNGKSVDEIRSATSEISNNQKLVMDVLVDLNEITEGYEDIPNILNHTAIEILWRSIANDKESSNFQIATELLDIGIKSSKYTIDAESFDNLLQIWTKLNGLVHVKKISYEHSFLDFSAIIMRAKANLDTKFIESYIYGSDMSTSSNLLSLVLCQALIIQNYVYCKKDLELEKIERCLDHLEALMDMSSSKNDFLRINEIMLIIIDNLPFKMLSKDELVEKIVETLKVFVTFTINTINFNEMFWKE